ncbi:sugar phosphate isomerase/epimerase family protein [Lacrimispora saccharolytica]|uniref:Xylose isomerase domain protein TIM barrel n=1 Tax=Lacrimispora saccharolytica (strain ATCC 35040 / DSM 2544 / NRCC 2533 / WM1) TaxID=610130 RepID=D9R487_LACSW|nr:sugar phosphate isomerase/epimerase family protein [Lacrimispora saccharolytica]ADL04957.1 Xylose isomerase domain protein TIM barrel [[Clostridium] saccharolyticum WM1]QRV20839.1 sugar phosphate isomerase/epimerase [Lacrimispora saccharolytica]
MSTLQLAIATDFAGEFPQIEKIGEILYKIAQAGFTHIHWCFEWDGDYMYSSYEMQQIREWMDQYGLRAKALHASKGSRRNTNMIDGHYRKDYTSEVEYNRKAGVELIKNRVDLAGCMGAKEIVLHLYVPHFTIWEKPETEEHFYQQVYRSFDELQPYCIQKGVRICIENLFDVPERYELDQLDRLLEKYPPQFIGFCLDTGHANMVWGRKMTDIIHRYQDRLYAVHIHDNSGSADFHQVPGEGNIIWQEVMSALARTEYELPLTLELTCNDENVDKFLKKAYEAGEELTGMYREEREKHHTGVLPGERLPELIKIE